MPDAYTPDSASGVWSAAPTPLTDDMKVDVPAARRMVEHHLRLGVQGLFLCGTNGEGPFLPDAEKQTLVRTVVKAARGRLPVAVQVSDNSAARILVNAQAAADAGADIAVIAPPYFMVNTKPDKVLALYLEAIEGSPLPVGIYDRGKHSSVAVPESVLKALYAHPRVVLAKDSSQDPRRRDIALAARRKRPELRLLSGDEFDCVAYLAAGYDGLLLGGGVFNGFLARQIVAAVTEGDLPRAEKLQARMTRMMFAVYGGKQIACWLSGEKKLLVELGLFSTWRNFPDYPLTEACCKAIERVLARDNDVLLP
jgi:4-hydroxy-tetrahydrodipicolinate synthase